MDDLCKCGHEMIDHRDGVGCEGCMCGGFAWPVSTSLDRAIEDIDAQIEELPKADSAGRSHVARERHSRWLAHQIHGPVSDGGSET